MVLARGLAASGSPRQPPTDPRPGDAANKRPHQFCAVRDCYFDAGNIALPLIGVSAGYGLGTVIEGNQFIDIKEGGPIDTVPTADLVVWNNFYFNVMNGVHSENSGAGLVPTGRIVVMDNDFQMADSTGAQAVKLSGYAPFPSTAVLGQAVVRGNLVRRRINLDTPGTNLIQGIKFANALEVVVENNWINDSASNGQEAVSYANCNRLKSFNNQDAAGNLLRAYDTSNNRWRLELQDELDDVYLPL